MERLVNVDMGRYTSFRAGGTADEMLIPETEEELMTALREIHEGDRKYMILGNGTNTLVRDGGYHGTVIKPGTGFSDVSIQGSKIVCGSAALLSKVAKDAMNAGLSGMEPISGIPGSIGGGVYMNAGAYGGEMKDVVESVRAVAADGSGIREFTSEEMDFGYRHSALMADSASKAADGGIKASAAAVSQPAYIVTSVTLSLTPGNKTDIAAAMDEYTRRRNEKQPVQYPSAGSFFKRPQGYFAGKLIEDSGLRGLTVGGAQVSELHCGFIINKGGATATDILELMRLVQNTVNDKFGVMLEPEVRIIGD